MDRQERQLQKMRDHEHRGFRIFSGLLHHQMTGPGADKSAKWSQVDEDDESQ